MSHSFVAGEVYFAWRHAPEAVPVAPVRDGELLLIDSVGLQLFPTSPVSLRTTPLMLCTHMRMVAFPQHSFEANRQFRSILRMSNMRMIPSPLHDAAPWLRFFFPDMGLKCAIRSIFLRKYNSIGSLYITLFIKE